METKHYHMVITGTVQGVALRSYVKRKADELGITGFIKNEKDGTVTIEAEGGKETLDAFVSWCYEGSPAAEVKNVIVTVGTVQSYQDFKIKY